MHTSRRSRRPIVLCIDVEPRGRAAETDELADWSGVEQAHDCLTSLRPRLAEATGAPVHFSWFLRMDPQIERVCGSASWIAERYRTLLRSCAAAGDEVGLHCHPWRWIEASRSWLADFADQRWVDRCVRAGFAAFRTALGAAPRSFRFGDRWMNDATLRLVDSLGARFDLTVEPGAASVTLPEPSSGPLPDYRGAPHRPYRPSRQDFRRPSRWWPRRLWEVPLTSVRLDRVLAVLGAGASLQRDGLPPPDPCEGWHDDGGPDVIAGWAFDPSRPARTVTVAIHEDGALLAAVEAATFRPDLLAAGKGDGRHGFELPLPLRLRDGRPHSIRVSVAGRDVPLAGTPRLICSSANGTDRAPPFLTLFAAYDPTLVRGMVEVSLDRDASPYLALVLRTSGWPADEQARIERNLTALAARSDARELAFATPAEAVAALQRAGWTRGPVRAGRTLPAA